MTIWRRRSAQPATPAAEPSSPLAHLYSVLADVLRDQVASQLDQASTNDLKSVAVLAAALAMIVALLIMRATDPTGIGYWWWYPLPLFIIPAFLAAMPLRRPASKRPFQDGPSIPEFLARSAAGKTTENGPVPYTLEEILQLLLVDLHTSWQRNDTLLVQEQRSFYWGAVALGVVTLIAIGLYAWGLS